MQLSALALYLIPYKETLCDIKSPMDVQIITDDIMYVFNSLISVSHCINDGQRNAKSNYDNLHEVGNYYDPIEDVGKSF